MNTLYATKPIRFRATKSKLRPTTLEVGKTGKAEKGVRMAHCGDRAEYPFLKIALAFGPSPTTGAT